MQMRKKKGSDQPRRLIIDFVFRYLDSRISLPLYQPLAGIYLKVNYEDRFMLRVVGSITEQPAVFFGRLYIINEKSRENPCLQQEISQFSTYGI